MKIKKIFLSKIGVLMIMSIVSISFFFILKNNLELQEHFKKWPYNFYIANRKGVVYWEYDGGEKLQCDGTKFIEKENYRAGILESISTTFLFKFSIKKNEIIGFDEQADERLYVFVQINDNGKRNNDTTTLLLRQLSESNSEYIVYTEIEYYMLKEIKNYKFKYYKNPVSLNNISDFYENKEGVQEITQDQLPEDLKNIDYKTKIDEIDKKLEARWNKVCAPAAPK